MAYHALQLAHRNSAAWRNIVRGTGFGSFNRRHLMRALNSITLLLVIVGGLNWLLVGIAQFDLVASIFGGQSAPLARIVYVLVGLSALWQLGPLFRSFSDHEAMVERRP